MLQVDWAGIEAFDVRTRGGAFAGIISQQPRGYWAVYFNSTATRGSSRKFNTAQDALSFIYARRIQKGFGV